MRAFAFVGAAVTRIALVAMAGAAVVGCGSSPPPAAPRPVAPAAAPSAPPPVADATAPSTLRRSEVRRVIDAGLGAFLQRVEVDERPVRVAGKFRGFRVAGLRGDPALWRGVDLRPGDVVTLVNGMPIERPEQALEAFRSLDVASELRVDLERDGAPRSLRYAIVDDGR